eukprot:CAMPEP_0184484466 /NCGR_PEP_ID=MMETSP0113_2-20130426/6181_1 /TAXON_ID=91329 /ORGANISM="Norrisiella sphaerica, Strain BC52" /LENGTH=1005 /DNA_ID=CAMNT_0026865467 /DNA_START=518 /DNA_END=3532 /DNA_ORIENTATION=+
MATELRALSKDEKIEALITQGNEPLSFDRSLKISLTIRSTRDGKTPIVQTEISEEIRKLFLSQKASGISDNSERAIHLKVTKLEFANSSYDVHIHIVNLSAPNVLGEGSEAKIFSYKLETKALELVKFQKSGKRFFTENHSDLVWLASNPLTYAEMQPDGTARIFTITPLDLETEKKQFKETLRQSGRSLRFKRDYASITGLSNNVTLGCKVLHYTGHGLESGLSFEDKCGRMHLVSTDKLKSLMESSTSGVELVFVAACHSEKAGEAFVNAGVKHVIAVRVTERVQDEGARHFQNQFYLSLIRGNTVKNAFNFAQTSLESMSGLLDAKEARKYLLLPEDADHEVRIFPDLREGKVEDLTIPLSKANLPTSVPQFMGRNHEVQVIVQKFLEDKNPQDRIRLVTIVGEANIGKTAVAIDATRYMHERGHFVHGVFWIPFGEFNESADEEAIIEYIATRMEPEKGELADRTTAGLLKFLRKKDVLLVMDGLDSLIKSPHIGTIITNILCNCSGVHILATCREDIGIQKAIVEDEIKLGPMPGTVAATLFLNLIGPSSLTPKQVGLEGSQTPEKICEKLATHPLVTDIIRGSPGRCWDCYRQFKRSNDIAKVIAHMKPQSEPVKNGGSDKLSTMRTMNPMDDHYQPMHEEDFTYSPLEDIKAESFWDLFKPRVEITFRTFKDRLQSWFLNTAEVKRTFSDADVRMMFQRGFPHSDRILRKDFAAWYKDWFIPYIYMIKKIRRLWDSGIILGVSFDGQMVVERLQGYSQGTFIMRTSCNNPGCIVIGYVDVDRSIKQMKIDCHERGFRFQVGRTHGKRRTKSFATLDELVLELSKARKVHIGTKQEIFGEAKWTQKEDTKRNSYQNINYSSFDPVDMSSSDRKNSISNQSLPTLGRQFTSNGIGGGRERGNEKDLLHLTRSKTVIYESPGHLPKFEDHLISFQEFWEWDSTIVTSSLVKQAIQDAFKRITGASRELSTEELQKLVSRIQSNDYTVSRRACKQWYDTWFW